MPRLIIAVGLALLPVPLAAQDAAPPVLGLEHRMLLRCSAAFAMIAHGQDNGDQQALAYGDIRESGREFFVISSARVMDEANLDRAQLAAAIEAEARDIRDQQSLDELMPVCLPLLAEG